MYKGFHYDAIGYLHTNNHWVVLHQVNFLEVIDCEGYGRNVWYSMSGDHVNRPDLPKVSLSCGGSGLTPSKTFDYGVYNPPHLVEGSFFSLPRAAPAPSPF